MNNECGNPFRITEHGLRIARSLNGSFCIRNVNQDVDDGFLYTIGEESANKAARLERWWSHCKTTAEVAAMWTDNLISFSLTHDRERLTGDHDAC